jgi:predicted phosphoribosyltransferase
VLINDRLLAMLGLSEEEVRVAIEKTKENVAQRVARYPCGHPFPDLAGRFAILTDDGLASGFTMLAALGSVRAQHPARIIVAVPTASDSSAQLVARQADELVCLNIRSGPRFAVAEAYRRWYDLTDDEVVAILAGLQNP